MLELPMTDMSLGQPNRRQLLELLVGSRAMILAAVAAAGLVAGLLAWLLSGPWLASAIWFAATLPPLAALLIQMVTSLRRGDIGLDAIAALSMTSALIFGETLAANVVALMYAGGQLLEAFADNRARRELTTLVNRVAHTAMRYAGHDLAEVATSVIKPGDRLLIRHGEVIPVDGYARSDRVELDLSALTGEAVPVEIPANAEIMSGATNVGPAFDLEASRTAADSTFAGIVAVAEAARTQKPPAVRLADRFALAFLGITVGLAGLAWWLSGDHMRALAVLVSATPCPLILAVPVAMIAGLSRSAKSGVLVKGGGALENLARLRVAIFDKTGTLTRGEPAVTEIVTFGSYTQNEILRFAASLDQASSHVLASALVGAATARGIELGLPERTAEAAGSGIEGIVGGASVALGGRSYVGDRIKQTARMPSVPTATGSTTVWVAVDGEPAGLLRLEDHIRSDAPGVIQWLRSAGLHRIVLATGDRRAQAEAIGRQLHFDRVEGDLVPLEKVAIVREEAKFGPVMMVGDGVNDAPALAAATVGVAMGARGEAASSEAADVVVLVDEVAPLAVAIEIARRTRRIALESVVAGLALSLVAMTAAALGYLPPVAGALVQEFIDVAVILNALRALR
jgi:heavy metal translocating P-type ATPase